MDNIANEIKSSENFSSQNSERKTRKQVKPSLLKKWSKAIELWVPFLTIVALVIASVEIGFVHQAIRKVDETAQKLSTVATKIDESDNKIEKIESSASTKFIGAFPENIPEVTKIVESTQTELIIVNDFVGYGHYSAPSKFDDYLNALIKLKNSGKKITIIVYDDETANDARLKQFKGTFETIKQSEPFKTFMGERQNNENVPTNIDEYYKGFVEREKKYKCDLTKRGVSVKEVKGMLPLFFWIVDGNRASFSFYTFGSDAKEASFETRDASLINIFRSSREEIENKAIDFKCSES